MEKEKEEEAKCRFLLCKRRTGVDWSHWRACLLPKDIAFYQPCLFEDYYVCIKLKSIFADDVKEYMRKYMRGMFLWVRTVDKAMEKGKINEPGLWVIILSFLLDMNFKDLKFDKKPPTDEETIELVCKSV